DAALPPDLLLQGAPVGERAGEAHERGVRGDRENAAAELPLEAVHDRQHDDERRHPERQPAHRDQRDEGYEAAPVGRAQIARADEPFVGAHRYSSRSASAGAVGGARTAGYTVASAVRATASAAMPTTLPRCS